MSRPRIFLSRSEPEDCGCSCWPARRAMVELLESEGCEPVVVDKQTLVAGQEWMQAITDGMASAHGLLLILSAHALASPHVQNELAMAEFRHRSGSFPIMVVTLPEVSREELENGRLGSLSPTRRQLVAWNTGTDPEEVRRELGPQLELLRAGMTGARVHQHVAHRLEDVDDHRLRQAADHLELPPAPLPALLRHRLAEGLLAERPSVQESDPLRGALVRLLPLPAAEPSREVIELSLIHARIPAAAAEQINRIVRLAELRFAVLVAAGTETARRYVHRASEDPLPWEHFVVPVTAATGPMASLVDGVEEELRERGLDDEAALREHEQDFGPVVAIVPHLPDPGLVAQLTTRFPVGLLFLFVVPDDCHGGIEEERLLAGLSREGEEEMNRTIRSFIRRYTPRAPQQPV
ncbi:toll/interleukin-1 receptor domain-containing protein [Peterkaempfera bronchialis]|uniref:TIR domain-containing protein n=1 Tax=Peterkaempfera bronchialis TaxID=2126346 RepID=A0A345T346_9ACTN|nr:toll/interleukin-1 receptor domain-containing protein [Peterkaempfera bronchialis]AXI80401.1 TIR domain-containing protein [Peterkaempfera bronchialis]